MNPLVSIILTTYNRKNLLVDALLSIKNQTYDNFECIIVDDGSTDGTQSLFKENNDDRIIYVRIPNSGSPAKPRNIGIEMANGEYIAFCDDDDIWFPEKIKNQINNYDDSIIAIGTNAIISNSNNKKFDIIEDIILSKNDISLIKSIPLSSLMVRRSGIKFNEEKKYNFSEDLLYKLDHVNKLNKSIKLLSEPLIQYRLDLGINNVRIIDNEINSLNVLNYYKTSYRKNIINKVFRKTLTSIAITAYKAKSRVYIKYLFKAISYSNFRETIIIIKVFISLIIKRRFI